MRISFIMFTALLIFNGCKKETSTYTSQNQQRSVKELEKAYDANKSDSIATDLIYAYGHEVNTANSKNDKINYLKKAISFTKKNGFHEYRIVFLKELIKLDPEGTSDELLTLGNIYAEEENTDLQSIIFLGFKKRFPNDPRIKDINHKIFLQLSDHQMYFRELIKDVYNKQKNGEVDIEKGENFIEQANAYALGFAGDPSVPNYLMIAADVARAIGDPNTSVGQYDWVYKYYPDYSNAPLALFLKGYEIENSLKQYNDAKKVYETFLQIYPNDRLAKDVKILIENLGKSPEEGFKEMLPVEQ